MPNVIAETRVTSPFFSLKSLYLRMTLCGGKVGLRGSPRHTLVHTPACPSSRDSECRHPPPRADKAKQTLALPQPPSLDEFACLLDELLLKVTSCSDSPWSPHPEQRPGAPTGARPEDQPLARASADRATGVSE